MLFPDHPLPPPPEQPRPAGQMSETKSPQQTGQCLYNNNNYENDNDNDDDRLEAAQ